MASDPVPSPLRLLPFPAPCSSLHKGTKASAPPSAQRGHRGGVRGQQTLYDLPGKNGAGKPGPVGERPPRPPLWGHLPGFLYPPLSLLPGSAQKRRASVTQTFKAHSWTVRFSHGEARGPATSCLLAEKRERKSFSPGDERFQDLPLSLPGPPAFADQRDQQQPGATEPSACDAVREGHQPAAEGLCLPSPPARRGAGSWSGGNCLLSGPGTGGAGDPWASPPRRREAGLGGPAHPHSPGARASETGTELLLPPLPPQPATLPGQREARGPVCPL